MDKGLYDLGILVRPPKMVGIRADALEILGILAGAQKNVGILAGAVELLRKLPGNPSQGTSQKQERCETYGTSPPTLAPAGCASP